MKKTIEGVRAWVVANVMAPAPMTKREARAASIVTVLIIACAEIAWAIWFKNRYGS